MIKNIKEFNKEYEVLSLKDKIFCLFVFDRVDKSIFDGKAIHIYEARHSDDDDMEMTSIEDSVTVNFMGTVISNVEMQFVDNLTLDDWGFVDIDVDIDFYFQKAQSELAEMLK